MAFTAEDLELKSSLSLPDAIESLGKCVRSQAGSTMRGRPAVGVVSENHIRLYWYSTFDFVSSFKPVFMGHFASFNGGSILRGSFVLSTAGQASQRIFYFFMVPPALSALLILAGLLTDGRSKLLPNALGLGGAFLVILFIWWFLKLAKRRWRKEVASMTELMKKALNPIASGAVGV